MQAYRKSRLYVPAFKSTLETVMHYIVSDIKKKARAFKIGVFTIFLVVSFVVTLKSLIDVAHIGILKAA